MQASRIGTAVYKLLGMQNSEALVRPTLGQLADACRSLFRLAALLGTAIVMTACDRAPQVNYRITVEVDTPAGVRTGSSVWSFRLGGGDIDRSYRSKFRGEAIAVDLPSGRTLFATTITTDPQGRLLRSGMGTLPETVYRRTGQTVAYEREVLGDRREVLEYISRLPRAPIALDCNPEGRVECPLLVRFSDPADPSSVEAVDPNNLTASFGAGYSLRRITLELTDDDPQFTLQERLAWLTEHSEAGLLTRHSPMDYSLPATLRHGDFQRR